MALSNPRAANDYTEIRSKYTTFKRKLSSTGAIDYLKTVSNPYPATTSTQEGQSVSMDSADTVKVGADGDRLVGKLIRSEGDGMCSVQTQGVAPLPYTAGADAPVVGRGVVCDGSGGVSIAAEGSEFNERGLVLRLDSTNLLAWVDLDIK
jgi:hypothetical protein